MLCVVVMKETDRPEGKIIDAKFKVVRPKSGWYIDWTTFLIIAALSALAALRWLWSQP